MRAPRPIARAVVLAALLLPGVAAAGGSGADAPRASHPRLVHVGHLVCLEYRGLDGVLQARCRPEHGTWADAGPALPVVAGRPVLVQTELPAARAARVHRHHVEEGFLGVGLALGLAGLGAALFPNGCDSDPISCALANLDRILFGYLAALAGGVVVTISAFIRFGIDTGPTRPPRGTPSRQGKP